MLGSVDLKIDGLVHTVRFQDDGVQVVVTELEWGNVLQCGMKLHPDLRRKLTQAVTEVVDGEVEWEDVDVKFHS